MLVPGRRAFGSAALAASICCALTHPAHADINGFNGGAGFSLNGTNPSITGNTLQITTQAVDQNGNPQGYQEANSAFFNTKQSISSFDAHFTYQLGPVNSNASIYSPADGFTFMLQNSAQGSAAVGHPGGFLGSDLTDSAAVAFNVYGLHQVGSTLYTGGNVTGNYNPTGDVNIASGDAINVDLVYKNDTLTEILTDTVTSKAFSVSYNTDLGAAVNGSSAYVGFTGGTGGGTADQFISNFSFTPQPVPEASTVVTFALLSIGGLIVLRRRRTTGSL